MYVSVCVVVGLCMCLSFVGVCVVLMFVIMCDRDEGGFRYLKGGISSNRSLNYVFA